MMIHEDDGWIENTYVLHLCALQDLPSKALEQVSQVVKAF